MSASYHRLCSRLATVGIARALLLVAISDYRSAEPYGQARKARHNTLFEADMLALPLPRRSHKM